MFASWFLQRTMLTATTPFVKDLTIEPLVSFIAVGRVQTPVIRRGKKNTTSGG